MHPMKRWKHGMAFYLLWVMGSLVAEASALTIQPGDVPYGAAPTNHRPRYIAGPTVPVP